MKIRMIALFLATTMIFMGTTPTAHGFEKLDRAIMNMIRNIGRNRGARRVRRPLRLRRQCSTQEQAASSQTSV